jgi:diadenylate cyclase
LHDGALIIRDGRLYAAGCILPLTQREDLSLQLGTRHRAAIGMTENSDAVVLIVSEETGTISISVNGQITRNYNSVSAGAELKRLLLEVDEGEKNSFFKSVLQRINLKSKKDKEEKNDEAV